MLNSAFTIFTFILLVLPLVNAHAFLEEPRQRGILGGNPFTKTKSILTESDDLHVSYDPYCHYPAGAETDTPGAGMRAQKRSGRGVWNPYEPTEPGFVFRAGVCGDLKEGKQKHLRGGEYYLPAESPYIASTYVQGGLFSATFTVIKHHNGFIEFTVCDVKKCGGEISEDCLRNEFICRKLHRAYDKKCEQWKSQECAPIDPNFPTRWYLPCSTRKTQVFRDIKFKLPNDLHCEHCVVQLYYTSANNCNPPGVVEFFRGPRGPYWWGDCPGEGRAEGGYRPPWVDCGGGGVFPEEYYKCSDIRITPRHGLLKEIHSKRKYSTNPIKYVKLFVGDEHVESIGDGDEVWTYLTNAPVHLEAVSTGEFFTAVYFSVQDETRIKVYSEPYTYPRYNKYWKGPFVNHWFWAQVTAETLDGKFHFIRFSLYFKQKEINKRSAH